MFGKYGVLKKLKIFMELNTSKIAQSHPSTTCWRGARGEVHGLLKKLMQSLSRFRKKLFRKK